MASYIQSQDGPPGRRGLVVALAFVGLSVLVMNLPSNAHGWISDTLQATALRPFLGLRSFVEQLQLRAEDTLRLQAQLDSLASQLASEGPLRAENRRLRDLLDLREGLAGSWLPATAFRPGTPGSRSVFLVSVGRRQGVRAGSPVISRAGRVGLAGVVREVREESALAVDWSHPDFRASAMNEEGSVFGFVRPDPGQFREMDRLLLDGVPYYEPIDSGTLIVTSGLGGVFPAGLAIGEVLRLVGERGRWTKVYSLRPVIELGSISHVLVATASDTAREGRGGEARPEEILPSEGGPEGRPPAGSPEPGGGHHR